jgi:hypothetical protein
MNDVPHHRALVFRAPALYGLKRRPAGAAEEIVEKGKGYRFH